MKKLIIFLIVITTLGVSLLPAARGQAAPVAQATNLLQNPGFEGSFGNAGGAQNWDRWHRETPRTDDECLVAYHYTPKWNRESNPTFVHSGSNSQMIGNTWDTWSGGIYQNVPASPGTTYRFTFQGRARGSNKQVPEPSETGLVVNMRAGIDPNGSGNWADSDVVWGAAGSPHDTWQTFTVETTATGNQITVFTFADWALNGVNQCRGHMDTWYDTAELVAVTPPTNTPAPLPTAAPATAVPPTATPAPTGLVPTEPAAATLAATLTVQPPTETATPAGSSAICANAFLDANANGLHDADEGFVGGVTLTVAQGSAIIGQAVSTGTESPICFSNLPAGTYQVGQTVPATLEMTTQGNATVDVGEGQTMGLEFGSRLRGTAVAEAPPDATATAAAAAGATATPAANGETGTGGTGGTPGWLVGLGIAAVVIGVVLLGTLLFMLLRR